MSSNTNKRKSGERASPRNEQQKLEAVLDKITGVGFTLGEFLYRLFGEFTKEELHLSKGEAFSRRSPSHRHKVSSFLSKEPIDPKHSVRNIISMIYDHRDAAPTKHRATAEHDALPDDDPTPMARHQLKLWAMDTAIDVLGSEAEILATKASELRLPLDKQNWQAVVEFSLVALGNCIRNNAPLIHRVFISLATSRSHAQRHSAGALAMIGEPNTGTRSPSNVS
jgi:hypothetical protein